MPLIKLQTPEPVAEDQQQDLLKALSSALAETIGKPEKYVMAMLDAGPLIMSGNGEIPAAFADVRSIGGLGPDVNAKLSRQICTIIYDQLGIPFDRVYINFADLERSNWGWNAETF